MRERIAVGVWVLMVAALVVGMVVLSPVVVHGQTKPPNPRTVEFTPSPDHAAATSYTIGYFLPGATDPVQTASIGKPTPNASNVCTATINVMPLTFGIDYTAKLKTIISAGVESTWSEPSNPFDRVPGPPGKPVAK